MSGSFIFENDFITSFRPFNGALCPKNDTTSLSLFLRFRFLNFSMFVPYFITLLFGIFSLSFKNWFGSITSPIFFRKWALSFSGMIVDVNVNKKFLINQGTLSYDLKYILSM